MTLIRHPLSKSIAVLTLLVGAGVTGAVELSDNGQGDLLLFPAISQSNGLSTAVSIRNSSDGEAVLARAALRSGQDGALLGAFHLMLPIGGTAAVSFAGATATVAGGACVSTSAEPGLWQSPATLQFNRAANGFLEVIEMARIPAGSQLGAALPYSEDAYELGSQPLPADYCAEVNALLADEAEPDGLLAPAGQLSGSAHLVEVEAGLSFSLPPTVLRNFRDQPLFTVADAGSPTLADASPAQSTVRQSVDQEVVSTWETGEDAVSAVLMTTDLQSAFSIEQSLGARSDVLLTFPTRHLYVGPDGDQERDPFVVGYISLPVDEEGQQIGMGAMDRRGNTLPSLLDGGTSQAKCSPPPPVRLPAPVLTSSQFTLHLAEEPVLNLGRVVQAIGVLPFDCFEQPVAYPIHERFESGNFGVALGNFSMTSLEGHVYEGLPVVASSVTRIENSQLQDGARANYGLVNSVKSAREVSLE